MITRKEELTFTGRFVQVSALNGCPTEIRIGFTEHTTTPLHAGNFEEMIDELREIRRLLWPDYIEASTSRSSVDVTPP